MKQHKWYILIGGLFYCAPSWAMLIPIVVDNFKASTPISDTILVIAVMMVFWCSVMNLIRVQYLEDEVEKLKKKLDEKQINQYEKRY